MTANFNLMDMMEKRNRSRFSQKTIFITIENYLDIFRAVEDIFTSVSMTSKMISDSKSSLDIFYESLFSEEYDKFVLLIMKYAELGLGIKEILTKIRYIITLIYKRIQDNEDEDLYTTHFNLQRIIQNVIEEYIKEESKGSYLVLLKSNSN
jgi:hypothetical protein